MSGIVDLGWAGGTQRAAESFPYFEIQALTVGSLQLFPAPASPPLLATFPISTLAPVENEARNANY